MAIRTGSKRSILVVGQTPPAVGGIATFVNRMMEAEIPPDWEMRFFSTTKRREYQGVFLGLWKGGFLASARNLWLSMSLLGRFALQLVWKRPGLVHVHTSHSMGFWWTTFFVLLARGVGCPVVLHLHGSRFKEFYRGLTRPFRWCVRRVLDVSDALVALSPLWEQYFRKELGVRSVHVVYNGIPGSFFRPAEKITVPSVPTPLRLLFVGALVKRKGIQDLVHALAMAVAKNAELVLDVVGDGEVEETRRLAQGLHLGKRVRFLGTLSGETLVSVYHDAHVLVLPSYQEGLPLVVLEAMAAGLAIVATPVGGIPDVVEDGVHGILVNPGDRVALSHALLRLANDRSQVLFMGKTARIAAEGFRFDSTMAALWKVYEAVLSRRSASDGRGKKNGPDPHPDVSPGTGRCIQSCESSCCSVSSGWVGR